MWNGGLSAPANARGIIPIRSKHAFHVETFMHALLLLMPSLLNAQAQLPP
jgi:hypothetical protein